MLIYNTHMLNEALHTNEMVDSYRRQIGNASNEASNSIAMANQRVRESTRLHQRLLSTSSHDELEEVRRAIQTATDSAVGYRDDALVSIEASEEAQLALAELIYPVPNTFRQA
jgi:hypothetical protein